MYETVIVFVSCVKVTIQLSWSVQCCFNALFLIGILPQIFSTFVLGCLVSSSPEVLRWAVSADNLPLLVYFHHFADKSICCFASCNFALCLLPLVLWRTDRKISISFHYSFKWLQSLWPKWSCNILLMKCRKNFKKHSALNWSFDLYIFLQAWCTLYWHYG